MDVEPRDTVKPNSGRRKHLLLAASKEKHWGIFPKAAKIGTFLKLRVCIYSLRGWVVG